MEHTALAEITEGHVPTTAESVSGLTKDGYARPLRGAMKKLLAFAVLLTIVGA